jgi:hypothetical protein
MKLNYLHSSSDIIFDAGIGGTWKNNRSKNCTQFWLANRKGTKRLGDLDLGVGNPFRSFHITGETHWVVSKRRILWGYVLHWSGSVKYENSEKHSLCKTKYIFWSRYLLLNANNVCATATTTTSTTINDDDDIKQSIACRVLVWIPEEPVWWLMRR